jgi:hypothetical protein
MGQITDICQSTQHDDLGSNYDGDSEVKMTRQDIAALRWPQRGSETRSNASFKGLHTGSRLHNDRQPDWW